MTLARIAIPSVRDVEILGTLSDEQRRAAGRIVVDAARETFHRNADLKDSGTKYQRISASAFFTDVDADDSRQSFQERLIAAGFLL